MAQFKLEGVGVLVEIISFISGNVAHRTQKKIDRQNRANIKQAHTHTHTHTHTEKKEKQIVEFSMQLYNTASSTSVHVNAKLHDSYMKTTNA